MFDYYPVVTKRKLARPRPSRFRRHWLLAPGTVFLNHGSFGACPIPILQLQDKLRRQMEAAAAAEKYEEAARLRDLIRQKEGSDEPR